MGWSLKQSGKKWILKYLTAEYKYEDVDLVPSSPDGKTKLVARYLRMAYTMTLYLDEENTDVAPGKVGKDLADNICIVDAKGNIKATKKPGLRPIIRPTDVTIDYEEGGEWYVDSVSIDYDLFRDGWTTTMVLYGSWNKKIRKGIYTKIRGI